MPNYPPSSFESAVAGFLQSYGMVRGMKRDASEQAIREAAAKRQDQLAQVQLNEAGYDVLPMPKIEAPPGQTWYQKIGSMISGGPPQPSEIVVKTHPSARDEDVAKAEAFTHGENQDRYRNERAIEELKIAAQTAADRNRNRTALQVASIDHSTQAAALEDRQRTEFFDNAVAAANGDPLTAMKNVEKYQMPQAQKFRASRADYYAAAARRNAPSEELKRARAELDLQRAGQVASQAAFYGDASKNAPSKNAPPPPLPPAPRGKPGDIVLPSESASRPTAAAKTSLAPLNPRDKAMAKTDPKFAAFLATRGYRSGVDF